jgi:hypothetical protein
MRKVMTCVLSLMVLSGCTSSIVAQDVQCRNWPKEPVSDQADGSEVLKYVNAGFIAYKSCYKAATGNDYDG